MLSELGIERHTVAEAKLDAQCVPAYVAAEAEYEDLETSAGDMGDQTPEAQAIVDEVFEKFGEVVSALGPPVRALSVRSTQLVNVAVYVTDYSMLVLPAYD